MRLRTAVMIIAVALPLGVVPCPPAAAQTSGLTLQQVERKYPRMNEVHIVKCDRDGDSVFTRGEMACVRSIYQMMYIEN